jgi:hypothetical protein
MGFAFSGGVASTSTTPCTFHGSMRKHGNCRGRQQVCHPERRRSRREGPYVGGRYRCSGRECIRCTQRDDLIHYISGVHRRTVLRMACAILRMTSPDSLRLQAVHVLWKYARAWELPRRKVRCHPERRRSRREGPYVAGRYRCSGRECIRCTQRDDLIHYISGIHRRTVLRMACAILRMTSPDSLRLQAVHVLWKYAKAWELPRQKSTLSS